MDWMIQVFRVLGNSSPQTFFTASSLLDRYFEAKTLQNVHVPSEKLYQIGVAVLFIASKFEDVQPIQMKQAYETIGRLKFAKSQILESEADILKTLSFRISCPFNFYQESSLIFKSALSNINLFKEISILKPEEETNKKLKEYMTTADRYILFMSLMT